MTTVAWFNCSAGVAGDMVLAALVDAGADPVAVYDAVAGLGVDGYAITFEPVQRCGVRATWANVVVHEPGPHDGADHHPGGHHGHDHDQHDRGAHAHRPARDVLALIAAADLPARVRDRATAVYRALAEVEGAVHGVEPDDVELHEVGALDSIVDVVAACAAMESLGVERIVCSPVAVGHGTVETRHGTYPNPVPAVTALLERAGAAAVGIDTTMELATPTGVALVTVLADAVGPLPELAAVTATGFGAGRADPPGRPNVVQVVVGRERSAARAAGPGRVATLLEANVDDVTGEVLAHAVAALLAAGAYDAWTTAITMKKGRPAHTVHALCDPAAIAAVADVLIAETGTLGVRATTVERWPQRRTEVDVDVGGHRIRVKLAHDRAKVEHDDAVAAARALGLPLRDVLRRAEVAALAARGTDAEADAGDETGTAPGGARP